MLLTQRQKTVLDKFATTHGKNSAILAVSGALRLTSCERAELILLAQNPRPIKEAIKKQLLHRGWVTQIKLSPSYSYEVTHSALTEAGLRAAEAVMELMRAGVEPVVCTNNQAVDWVTEAIAYLDAESEIELA